MIKKWMFEFIYFEFWAVWTVIPRLMLEKLLFWGFALSWSSEMETKLQLYMNYYQHFIYSKKSRWTGPKKERAESPCQYWWFLRIFLSPALCVNVLRLIKWSVDGISNLPPPHTHIWCLDMSRGIALCERSGRIKVSSCLCAALWTARQAEDLNPCLEQSRTQAAAKLSSVPSSASAHSPSLR